MVVFVGCSSSNDVDKIYSVTDKANGELINGTIDLIAKRNNVESKRYRSLVELNQLELDKIDYLFSYPKNYNELENYIKKSLDIIFDEFDYWKSNENIEYKSNINFLIKFIEENRD